MRLVFCGAAGGVTGSCFLVESYGVRFLVDCGMFQGTKDITRINYEEFPFKPRDIGFVLLTHAHIDHSGLLPKLVREGFKGSIFATPATIDLCKIMLEDSAHVQQMETEMENKRRKRQGVPEREPLYILSDVKETFPHFKKTSYHSVFSPMKGVEVEFFDAGHIIGSAIIRIRLEDKALVFSGDLGQRDVPIVRDPEQVLKADYVIMESTYGDRMHEDPIGRDELLVRIARETYAKGGRLLIPSFAVERTQELLYSMRKSFLQRKFPNEKVYLDSPLAIKATRVFERHPECYDETVNINHPFSFKNLVMLDSTHESKMLNEKKEPYVVIAGSGMANAGRIRHHLKHGLWDPRNTVLFVGFQAKGTLGRFILEGAKKVRMMGTEIAVKAKVEKINGFSAHADQRDLLWWASGFKKPMKVFIVHGEEKPAQALKEKLTEKGFQCKIPARQESFIL
ncbi:MAG: MBL fold metallo-hydrolase [Nanoarchaeota archaeon]